MIDQCDPTIAVWSSDGESFTIKDVEAFEKAVLSHYFNHSRFSSFARQLNFYAFHKMSSDADLNVNTKSVRFYHKFFQKGKPELLHRIKRATAQKTAPNSPSDEQVESSLKEEFSSLNDRITSQMEERLEYMAKSLENDYLFRLQQMEAGYQNIISSLLLRTNGPMQFSTMVNLPPSDRTQVESSIRSSKVL
jgi:hypothetical protein